jgi:drug/metabolite transporter (DMT)-like permease
MKLTPVMQGLLWMMASTASFSAMIIAVRYLADTIPPFEQVFLRSVISLAIGLPMVIRVWRETAHTFRPNALGRLYAGRGLSTYIGVSAWFFAIAALPLAEAVALHFTLPIIGLILSAVVLREHITRARWMAVVIGFGGVLIILRPGAEAFDIMALVVLLSAAGYASGDIFTKLLSRTEPVRLIVVNLNIYLIIFAAIPTALNWHTPPASDIPMILVMGVTAWMAHMCLAQAMKRADASVIIPMEFIRLPITAVGAYIFFAEVPGVWTMVGAAVIFFGTWQLARKEGGH